MKRKIERVIDDVLMVIGVAAFLFGAMNVLGYICRLMGVG